jgi:Fur family peroxide stress response transcriptional regulator
MLTIKQKIRESGLKATPQRIAIYDAMQKLGHASADMVVEELNNVFPSLTIATIYNVLDSFVERGLVVRRYSSNNKMYFDVNTYEHAHFYDMNTNMHVDFTDPELIKLVTDYVNAKGLGNFKLSTVDIQLIGEMN